MIFQAFKVIPTIHSTPRINKLPVHLLAETLINNIFFIDRDLIPEDENLDSGATAYPINMLLIFIFVFFTQISYM